MKQFHNLYASILAEGTETDDRTGVGTISKFGHQMRFDLISGFPLLGTKQTSAKMILVELLWFLKGNPNIDYLHEHGCTIWDEWVKEDGTFGPIYGAQWRSWVGNDGRIHDQIANVINSLRNNPSSRRHIVSAWNVPDVESGEMALPPCHVVFQFHATPLTVEKRIETIEDSLDKDEANRLMLVAESEVEKHHLLDNIGVIKHGLSCHLYQRSADAFLGVPYNVASYSFLTHMIAQQVNMIPLDFIWTGGDVHLYKNHLNQVNQFLNRPWNAFPLPKLKLNPKLSIDDYDLDDFEIIGYQHLGRIKAPIAV